MANIFDFEDYKTYLNQITSSEGAPRGIKAELAKVMGCQAAYFSQVLNGKAELTEDQAFRLVRHLNFNPAQTEYFLLLLRINRAASSELKNHLMRQLKNLSRSVNKVGRTVGIDKLESDPEFISYYFSSWIPTAIHLATSCKTLQTIQSMVARYQLSEEIVLKTLQRLQEQGLVKKNNDHWVHTGIDIHLPKESPLYAPHQSIQRLRTIQMLQSSSEESLHVCASFAVDKETYQSLHQHFLNMLQKAVKKIQGAPAEEVYSFTIDLYKF